VAEYLATNGYEILARNLRLGPLELDVVARLGDLVAVVEVKTRGPGARQGPFASFTRAKSARVRRAVERLWRETLSQMDGVNRVRVDVAAVTFVEGQVRVEYVEGALA
jgi:putative endonuclease